MTSRARSQFSQIASNGSRAAPAPTFRSPTPSTAASDSDAAFRDAAQMQSATGSRVGMSRRSQLTVVATSTLVFAGLLVYLSSVLYPLVVLGGVYAVMQRDLAVDPRGLRVWQTLQASIEECKAKLGAASDLSTAKKEASRGSAEARDLSVSKASLSASCVTEDSPPAPGSPIRRRSRIVAVRNSRNVQPSLRVTNVGVTSDGLPSALPGNSQDVLDYIVQPNSAEPYEFENEFMKGSLLFLLQRLDQSLPEKYAAIFDGKRRLFWVQLQVQFKKVPSGILYIGGEVPRSMNLGFFTGGLTKIILSVLQSLVRGLHCSFGQIFPGAAKTWEEEELPHICFPLYTAVDQFVVTPPGGKLPMLGSIDFGESKESMAARRKSGQPMYQYNTTDTYSFHFHSFFIDFAKWRLNGLPGMNDTPLSAFWEDMPLRLCAYSLKPTPGVDPNSESEAKKAVHSWNAKEYKFCFQLSHKVQDEYEVVEDLAPVDAGGVTASGGRSSEVKAQQYEVRCELARYEFSIPAWFEYFSKSSAHAERRVGYAFRVREFDQERDSPDAKATQVYYVLLTAVSAFSPLAYIEHELSYPVRRGSGRNGVFANSKAKTLEESISVKSSHTKYVRVDEERQFLEHQLRSLAAATVGSGRFSPEQTFQAQSALLEILQRKNESLGGEWPFLASAFVRKNSFGSSANMFADTDGQIAAAPVKESLHAASQIVRAISSSCWRNEWVTLDKLQRVLRFFRMNASSPSRAVSLDAVLKLEDDVTYSSGKVSSDEVSSDLFWVRVVTIEKCHHIAFACPEDRQLWTHSLRNEIELAGKSMDALMRQPVISSCMRVEVESFATGTATKSRGAKRNVLNDRCDFFTSHDAGSSDVGTSNPNEIVAAALRQAIQLQHGRLDEYSTRDLLDFLDAVSMLKWVKLDAIKQDEVERKVFLLNLYHLMLLHSSILGFLPKSKTQWSKFFNGVNYNVGGTLLSIAEVEHGLIRAPMAPLKLAIAFLVIPKVNDSDERAPLRLTTPDFRVNFALNCLTKSCTNSIMVFTTQDLERQLDRITSLTVDYAVSYDRESKILFLPKVCEWYRGDFTSDPTNRWQQSCVALLRKYMTGTKAQLVDYLIQHGSTLVAKWKFSKYDYRFHEFIQEAGLADTEEAK